MTRSVSRRNVGFAPPPSGGGPAFFVRLLHFYEKPHITNRCRVAGFVINRLLKTYIHTSDFRQQLRSEFESALKAKDANGIIGMFNWQGVSDNLKTEMRKEIAELVKHEWTAVRLTALPADYQATNVVNGIRYRPSVTVTGWVVVDALPKGNAAKFPYGKSGDTFYLSCNVAEKISGPTTKSKILNIEVMGTAGSGTFSGTYVYVQGAKEIKRDIINRGASFYGDHVKSCTVQKTTGSEASIQLTITEDGKTVFESGEVTNKEPIVYEKK